MTLNDTMTRKERSLWICERMNHTMTRPVEGCQAETPRYGTRTKSREDKNKIPLIRRINGIRNELGSLDKEGYTIHHLPGVVDDIRYTEHGGLDI